MQEIINAVVIDDNEKELLEVTKALALKAISTIPIHYTDPSSTYQKCEKSSEAVPRIIITYIKMHS